MSQARKQVPLRLSAKLYEQVAAWAQDDFRSINGQIEYLLSEAVRKRRGGKHGTLPDPKDDLEQDGQEDGERLPEL